MACPAFPLCGLAVTEAERALPDINKRLRAIMNKLKMNKAEDTFVVRMTGCPNGCARPYMAELGFVGDGPNSYQVRVAAAGCEGTCSSSWLLLSGVISRFMLTPFQLFFCLVLVHLRRGLLGSVR